MHSARSDWVLPQPGFPIQTSPDQHLFASSPELIAGYHVFRRLSMPRHPPHTLSSLTTFIDHRRCCLRLETSLASGRASGRLRQSTTCSPTDNVSNSPKKVLGDPAPDG